MSLDPSFDTEEGRAIYHINGACAPESALDSMAALCHVAPMTIARISELERKTTQSGKAQAGRWLLEFERQQGLRPDPLTGWNGSSDTRPQVRLTFQTKEAAIAYCAKRGLEYHVVAAAPARLKIQTYADNFR
jgi:hypothetical protein